MKYQDIIRNVVAGLSSCPVEVIGVKVRKHFFFLDRCESNWLMEEVSLPKIKRWFEVGFSGTQPFLLKGDGGKLVIGKVNNFVEPTLDIW